jgi:tetratricopeptide (TPR) repeat protein
MAYVIAEQGDMARAIALYEQSLKICEQIGDVQGKAHMLRNITLIIAQQGDMARAIALSEQALEIYEQIGNVKGKAHTLNNMAGVIAKQGDIPKAIALSQQALKIFEQIGYVQGKAVSLSHMARVIAEQGDILKAITLYEQALEICEQTGDVKGKATTLNNMAEVIAQQGDIPGAITLYEQAALAFAQIRAYSDLITTLSNLGVADESNGLVHLAQAIWLTLRIQTPLPHIIQLICVLYNTVPQGDELAALLGATVMCFCQFIGKGHPQFDELRELSGNIIIDAASVQGVETLEALQAWYVQQRLNDPEYFLPRFHQRLEEIVGDGWLFDRSQGSMGK